MESGLYLAGEFAERCQITRDTLEHYTRTGLLRPYTRASNGYGYYSPEQEYTVLLIRMLQTIGYSLKEIKTALYSGGVEKLFDMMHEKEQDLRQRQSQIDYALKLHDYYRQFRQTTLDLATTEMRIVDNPAEFYIFCTAFETEDSYRSHVLACQARPKTVMGFPVGSYYSMEKVAHMDFEMPSGYCSYCVGKPKDVDAYQMIPRGMYATYRYMDSSRSANREVTAELLSFIKNSGYVLSGALYVIPFAHSIDARSGSDYDNRIFGAVALS